MQTRSFASAATALGPKIPLTLHGIDGRYATALYSAASSATTDVKKVQAEVQKLVARITSDQKLSFILNTPIFNKTIKQERINRLVKECGVSVIVSNFLGVLADNGRLDMLSKIVHGFDSLISAAGGEVTVIVTSAQPLDKTISGRLAVMLKGNKLVGVGQTPKVVSKVDPEIIGGLIIEIDGKTIDLSVSAKVTKLNRLISEAI